MTDTLIPPERLERWVTSLLEAHGTPPAGAGRVAHALVDADRCGHRSHGVRQLPCLSELPGFVAWVKSAAPPEGTDEILIPGEPEARRRAATGEIALDEPTLSALAELGHARGLAPP
jgi:LDH2 family malate/lactate/ureidoglycolate dehydrogenase